MAMINMQKAAEREEMPGEIEADEPRYPYGRQVLESLPGPAKITDLFTTL